MTKNRHQGLHFASVDSLGRIEILVVCTGNICRSPIAEAILADRLRKRGIEATVSSAGLLSAGRPVSDHSVTVARARGLDIAAHRSRALAGLTLDDVDLVLGMARRHVREAVVASPTIKRRTFTLKELVRRAETAAGSRRHDEDLHTWLARIDATRQPGDLLGDSAADDIADPIGESPAFYERVAAEIEDHVDRLVALAWPASNPSS